MNQVSVTRAMSTSERASSTARYCSAWRFTSLSALMRKNVGSVLLQLARTLSLDSHFEPDGAGGAADELDAGGTNSGAVT